MSKPNPIEFMAFWAASKRKSLAAITQFEGLEHSMQARQNQHK